MYVRDATPRTLYLSPLQFVSIFSDFWRPGQVIIPEDSIGPEPGGRELAESYLRSAQIVPDRDVEGYIATYMAPVYEKLRQTRPELFRQKAAGLRPLAFVERCSPAGSIVMGPMNCTGLD